MRLVFIASYSHLARRLSTFFGARGFRLCENGPTNLLWPTKGGFFCIDRMGECYLGRRVEASEPNKPGGHRHASPNCIPGDPHSVRVRFDADGHSTNRRVPPSSTRLSRSPRLGDSGPSARCPVRNDRQVGEPHPPKLRGRTILSAVVW